MNKIQFRFYSLTHSTVYFINDIIKQRIWWLKNLNASLLCRLQRVLQENDSSWKRHTTYHRSDIHSSAVHYICISHVYYIVSDIPSPFQKRDSPQRWFATLKRKTYHFFWMQHRFADNIFECLLCHKSIGFPCSLFCFIAVETVITLHIA